ncbi:hypothetical protein [Coleofasciculus chthonoplastes]|jgi:hypothetical protein|uniref:hypothetical protein n=1 Tax=Coleofasciculus chthonoplastes TaxID=64178 RepID=UPI003300F62E
MKTTNKSSPAYELDFYGWTQEQAKLLQVQLNVKASDFHEDILPADFSGVPYPELLVPTKHS